MSAFQWRLSERISFLQPIRALPETVEAKAHWLVNLRWVAIAAQVICIPPGLSFGFLTIAETPVFATVIVLLAIFNVVFPFIRRSRSVDEIDLLLHLVVDLSALSILLLLSQGARNPLIALFYLNAALGALILSGIRNLVFLCATCGAFATVYLLSNPPGSSLRPLDVSREVTLSAELIIILLIWQLVRWVAAQLATLEKNLRELEQQKSKIDHLRALGAMAASFSHKFATPLNTIKLRLDRLNRGDLDAGDRAVELSSAKAAVIQCEGALRLLVPTDRGSLSTRVDEIVLAPFIETICRHWQRDHVDTDFRFIVDADAHTAVCRLPSLALTRSIIDLLDNAVQASAANDVEIAVALRATAREAFIEIADRGCGISSEIKSRIGEPFISTRESGSGLGLYTAQSLAKAFGGDLQVQDRRGGGTIVTLSFPIHRGEADP